MLQCYICGTKIPREQRYKSFRYKSIPAYSEACYNVLLEQKANTTKAEPYPGYNKLTGILKPKESDENKS